jgi:hypothetical protein
MSFGFGCPLLANARLIKTVDSETLEASLIQVLYDRGIVSGRSNHEYMICPELSMDEKSIHIPKKEETTHHMEKMMTDPNGMLIPFFSEKEFHAPCRPLRGSH